MANGWFRESYRHSLASKGVKTSLASKGSRLYGLKYQYGWGKTKEVAEEMFNKKPEELSKEEVDKLGKKLHGNKSSMAGIEEQGILREAAAPLVPQIQPVVQPVEPAMMVQQEPSLVQQQPIVQQREEYQTLGDVLRDIDKNTISPHRKPGSYQNFGDILKDIRRVAFNEGSKKKSSMAMKGSDKDKIMGDDE